MSNNPLDDLAPYPQTYEAATADAIARCYAVVARKRMTFVDRAMDDNSVEGKRRYMDQIGLLVGEFTTVCLIRALAEHAPEKADEVAREVWDCWEDGGVIATLTWSWLVDYGIDPEQVSALAGEMWDRHMAKQEAEATT